MPVNYIALGQQITSLGDSAIQRNGEIQEKLARCRQLLAQYANEIIPLQQKVEEAVSRESGLRCAKPYHEALTLHASSPVTPGECVLLAADGSQITPNPHEPVLFGLVNIGVFRMPLNLGGAPSESIESVLLYDDALFTSAGMISDDLVGLLRDVREREVMVQLVRTEKIIDPSMPVITLTDGPLEFFHEPRTDKQFAPQFNKYLAALDELSLQGAITAGYVDRPRADLVVRLMELVESSGVERPFTGLTDLLLFSDLLQPGERTAVFELQSTSSKTYVGNKALHFFYLNVSRSNKPAIARVEIPAWVARDKDVLNLLQSVLVDQANTSGNQPYPYALLRAHEIAVVKREDNTQLTWLIEQELIRQGFDPSEKSNKQSGKDAV